MEVMLIGLFKILVKVQLVLDCMRGWTIAQKTVKEAESVKMNLVMVKSGNPCCSLKRRNIFSPGSHGKCLFLQNLPPLQRDFWTMFRYTSGLFLHGQTAGDCFPRLFQSMQKHQRKYSLQIVKPEKQLLSLKPLLKKHVSNKRSVSSKALQYRTATVGIQLIVVEKNQDKTQGTEVTQQRE